MVIFQVPDMTCAHCASSLEKAVAALDNTAVAEVDIPQKLVRITSKAPTAELARAIEQAGYIPQQWQAAPSVQPSTSRPGGGCGCGSRKTAPVHGGQIGTHATRSCCG